MSTYVLMRILESAPHRYDLGMRLLTLGRLGRAYDRLASRIHDGQRVLDIGCGTGALSLRAAGCGAQVSAIDVNAQMLEIARQRAYAAGLTEEIDFREMGIAELGGEASASYDVVTSGLCFSELSEDEIHYALKQIGRILKPGGLLLIADEVKPPGLVRRMIHALSRAPLVALAYVVTQQTTHAVENLSEKVTRAGFSIESIRLDTLGSFVELAARAPDRAE